MIICKSCGIYKATLFDPDTGDGFCIACEAQERLMTDDTNARANHANFDQGPARANFLRLIEKVMDDLFENHDMREHLWMQLVFLDCAGALPANMIPQAASLRHFARDFFTEANRCIQARLREEPLGEAEGMLPERVVAWVESWASMFVGPQHLRLAAGEEPDVPQITFPGTPMLDGDTPPLFEVPLDHEEDRAEEGERQCPKCGAFKPANSGHCVNAACIFYEE